MEELYLPLVNLTPTMKCNLKCKLCGVLVPHYDYRPQMTIEEFKRTIDALFEIVDRVGKLQITGGEPFMYPFLAEAIKYCFNYSEKFDKLWVFTNCSLPLKKEVCDELIEHKEKVFVHISDYGLAREASTKLIETIKSIGCEYRYLKYFDDNQYCNGWVDQGDFIKHNRNEDELKKVFTACPHVDRGGSWYIRNGQMHWCGRSIRGTEVGKIPLREEDYLNIFDGTVTERREKLETIRNNKYIIACDYCNGNYGVEDKTKRYPAGEQM